MICAARIGDQDVKRGCYMPLSKGKTKRGCGREGGKEASVCEKKIENGSDGGIG